MGLNNEQVSDHINALFGEKRANNLRKKLATLSPIEREHTIVNEICAALIEMGREYILPFSFKSPDGKRTSHHLIFVSKHVKGYEIMKGIMARHSSTLEQGVASFDFNPVANIQLRLLFDLSRPLDELADMLLDEFAGKTLKMKEIYEQHHVGKPYVSSNYKEALNILEEKGLITCNPPAVERRKYKGKRTFADKVLVTFPTKSEARNND